MKENVEAVSSMTQAISHQAAFEHTRQRDHSTIAWFARGYIIPVATGGFGGLSPPKQSFKHPKFKYETL